MSKKHSADKPHVAVVFDDRVRPETTGSYCKQALSGLCKVRHLLPEDVSNSLSEPFDFYLFVDDGLGYSIPKVPTLSAYWAIDTHLNLEWSKARVKEVDLVFAAQKDGARALTEAGFDCDWLPLACDPQVHRPHRVKKEFDVCFLGMMAPGPRAELLALIQREYPNSFVGQRYFDAYARTISQSRIGFNRSILNDLNMRVFETLACGTLLLTNDLPDNGQEELLESQRHLLTYDSPEQLLERIRYYLKHRKERERIAQAGRHVVLQKHTYAHRMQTVLSRALGRWTETRVFGSGNGKPNRHDKTKVTPSSVAQPFLDEVDFVIKTYLRPQALVRLLRSIEHYYPNAQVTIADDGGLGEATDQASQACQEIIKTHPTWNLCELPRDSGVVVGRNALIDCTTRPYLLFLDDDFCFQDETRIERLWERLQDSPEISLVAGCCQDIVGDQKGVRNSGGTFSIQGDTLVIETQGWRDKEQGLRDYVPQFFMARRDLFTSSKSKSKSNKSEIRWRTGLGGEHYDFCLQLKTAGIGVAQDLTVVVDHYPATEALPGYGEKRQTVDAFQQEFLKLWKLKRVVQDGTEILSRQAFPSQSLADPNIAQFACEKQLHKDAWYFDFPRPEVASLVPQSARKVLDIGCGSGALGALLKSRGRCEVVGVEIHPGSVARARERLDQVVQISAESPDLSFPPQSFDCVICADVLEHLRNPEQLLAKIRTWLRPEGRLVLSVPNVRHHSILSSLLDGNWTYESAGLLDQDHVRFFTRRELEKLLYRTGFEVQHLGVVPGPGDEVSGNGPLESKVVKLGRMELCGLSADALEEFFTYQFLTVARPSPRRLPKEYPLTSIVLVTFNECPYTRACLDSLRQRTDEPYEIIVVDNGSTDETLEYLRSLPDVRLIVNRENRGFPAAANQGIQAARGANIVLLNNDTLLTTGWLRRMLEVLERDPAIGLVGPVTNNASGIQVVTAGYERLESLDGFAWEWRKAYAGQTVKTDRLVGFCLLFRRSVVDRIGLLDERFGIGNFEDDDFCRRALRAGFQAWVAADTYIHHFGSRSFRASGIDFRSLLEENRKKYEQKWASRESAETAIWKLVRSPDGTGLLLTPASCSLSACLIVRNNQDTLAACLAGIRPFVDDLVVVDTGSTDATPEIAKSFGARLFHFPWCDDFSAARNVSLSHANGEWIFWMDSDDTISAECGRRLREIALGTHAPDVLGYVMQVHCPGPEDGTGKNVTVVDHVKLIRNRPDLRFEGRIHEQLLPAIRRAGGAVEWTDVYVVHSGADQSPEGFKRKLERDFRILEQELRDHGEHPFVLFNLGMTYADAKDYERAIEYLNRCLQVSVPEESHVRKAYALLASAFSESDRPEEAWNLCEQALKLYPDDKELLFRAAMLHHHLGRLDEAEKAYLRVLYDPQERHFSSLDQGITSYKARHNLALVYEDMGNWNAAREQWEEITRCEPEYALGWRGLGNVLLHEQDLAAAQQLAARLVQQVGTVHREGLILRGRIAAHYRDVERARSDFESADRLANNDVEPLHLLCRLEFERNNLDRAVRCLEELTQRSPEDAAAFHNLGTIQFRQKLPRLAAQSYRRSLALRPNSAATWLHLGWALCEDGQQGEAALAWQEVLRHASSDSEGSALVREAEKHLTFKA